VSLIYRRRVRLGEHTTGNLSRSGVSFTERFGRVSANTRGRVTVRLGRGLSWRFGGRR
jgi:hypothetical protein